MNLFERARTHLRAVAANARGEAGDNGSLLLAILLTVLITSLIAAATITTVAGQRKTQIAARYSQGQQSADGAVADVLRYANQGGDPGYYDGLSGRVRTYTPAASAAETTGWTWTATPTANGAAGDEYDVTITTVPKAATKPVRTYKIHISAVHVPSGGATVTGNTISYAQTDGPNAVGFFADGQVALRGSSRVDSYNSNAGSATTGVGAIGSNDIISFSSGTLADKVTLWNFTARPDSDRCTGVRCSTGDVGTQPYRLGGSGSCEATTPTSSYPGTCTNNAPTRFVDATCTGKDIKPWIASENGTTPTLTGGTDMCVSSLLFDRNTVVNASPANPVRIYVTGHGTGASPAASGSDGAITVLPGVSVNAAASAPVSTNLLIYAKSANVTLLSGGAAHTRVAWGLWAPNANCGGQDPAASGRIVHIYGAMTCGRISTGNAWYLHYDEQQRLLNGAPPSRAWSLTSYQAD